MKDINVEDRLIFALDVPEVEEAKDIVSELDESVNFYKIGMELLMTGKYFELLNWLVDNDKKVFVDLKFFDVLKLSAGQSPDLATMAPHLLPFMVTRG